MTNILDSPGLLTAQDLTPSKLAEFKQHGYAWVARQAQNDHLVFSTPLTAISGAGMSGGVWGVSYHSGNFGRDGFNLGKQAAIFQAQHVQMDVEFAAKNTRPAGMKTIIDGIRQGGWQGPVHLNTLGAPSNPDVNDFAMDVQSFLDTGGGVIAQAYLNESPDYAPALCKRYWLRMGVPEARLNYMVGLYDGRLGRLTGAQWVQALEQAGVERNISVFLAETAVASELDALDAITKAQPPAPPPPPPPAAPKTKETREKILAAAEPWIAAQGSPVPNTRIQLAARMAGKEWTYAQWKKLGPKVAAVLDEGP